MSETTTPAQKLEDSITSSLATIAVCWPAMLTSLTRPSIRPGSGSKAARNQLDDHDRRDTDVTTLDRIISLRREVIDSLNAIAREVVEERHIVEPISRLGGTAHPVDGFDALDLIAFLKPHAGWLAHHGGDPDYTADELHAHARTCKSVVLPPVKDTQPIGSCPLQVPDEDGLEMVLCGGRVDARPIHGATWEADAKCRRCGTSATVSWWEARMFDDPELRRTLTEAEVVALVHRLYGKPIQPATVRQWVARGVIVSSGTVDGRKVYDRDAVVWAYEYTRRGGTLTSG